MRGFSKAQIAVPLIILLVILVGDATLYRPRQARLSSLAQDVARAEHELLCMVEHDNDLRRAAELLPNAGGSGDDGNQSFLALASEGMDGLGLVLKRVEPERDREYGGYRKRAYSFQIEGGYHELVAFLSYLEELPEVVVIDFLEIRSDIEAVHGGYRISMRFSVIGY